MSCLLFLPITPFGGYYPLLLVLSLYLGEVTKQDLDLRALCGTSRAEAHVPVRGSAERNPCGLSDRPPDAHVTAAAFSGAAVGMVEVLLRTRRKAAAGV